MKDTSEAVFSGISTFCADGLAESAIMGYTPTIIIFIGLFICIFLEVIC